MDACCFGTMLKGWKNIQFVVQRGMLWKPRGKETAKKVLIYFPIDPSLRLYVMKTVAEHMTWHCEHTRIKSLMEHPRDAKA